MGMEDGKYERILGRAHRIILVIASAGDVTRELGGDERCEDEIQSSSIFVGVKKCMGFKPNRRYRAACQFAVAWRNTTARLPMTSPSVCCSRRRHRQVPDISVRVLGTKIHLGSIPYLSKVN